MNEHEYFLKAKSDLQKHHHEMVTKVGVNTRRIYPSMTYVPLVCHKCAHYWVNYSVKHYIKLQYITQDYAFFLFVAPFGVHFQWLQSINVTFQQRSCLRAVYSVSANWSKTEWQASRLRFKSRSNSAQSFNVMKCGVAGRPFWTTVQLWNSSVGKDSWARV